MSGVLGRAIRTAGREMRSLHGVLFSQSKEKLGGAAANYWSSSENDQRIKELSHWRGCGRWSDDEAWLAIGTGHRARCETLSMLAGRGPIESMIEWGPGGGSNAVAFSSVVHTYYGVDISPANLEECQRQVAKVGFAGFRPVVVDPSDIAAVKETCRNSIKPVDFFLSSAVFQHFPSKEFGLDVLAIANSLLKPGGIAMIQTRYDDGSIHMRSKRANYTGNAQYFTSYGIDEFWIETEKHGFRPLAITLAPSVCYAFYYLARNT